MSMLTDSISFLLPYEFSPTVLAVCGGTGWLYVRGRSATNAREPYRAVLFWLGLILIYGVLQTKYDYYAVHMFFIHRLQHLILHHLAPFLIVLAAPKERLLAGAPTTVKRYLIEPMMHSPILRAVAAIIQQPLISSVIFVGLIYFWLTPNVHFIAMLNLPLYNVMNWGMAVDGLLFWWMVFDKRAEGSSAASHYGGRILLLFLVMFPQIIIGAYITLSNQNLFDVYDVCGRAWPLSERTDQQIGGLITWIHASMMSVAGALVLLQRWMRHREQIVVEGEACRELS